MAVQVAMFAMRGSSLTRILASAKIRSAGSIYALIAPFLASTAAIHVERATILTQSTVNASI